MPKTITYSNVKKYISAPRIGTYENFFTDHSSEEVYGIYLWNKALCGAMYPLLQAVEVALRNAINTSAVQMFGTYWYNRIAHHPHNGRANYNHTKLVDNFEKARSTVVKQLNKNRRASRQTLLPSSHQPAFDLVVAATDFSTWEFALHNCHFQVGNNSFLWPKQTKKGFKNWPDQSSLVTHTYLYDTVAELRPFRNRLSHHEPLWKGVGVTTEQEALKFVRQKIQKIEDLLDVMSKDKTKYLNIQKLITKAKHHASTDMLDICRYRAKGKTLTIRHKKKIRKVLLDIKKDDGPTLLSYAGRKYLVESI